MKTIEILVGIPCSGKSRYANKKLETQSLTKIISRDAIREHNFGKKYKQNQKSEVLVTHDYQRSLIGNLYFSDNQHIILDNTHCKEHYINDIIKTYSTEHKIVIRFFDVPLWLCHYRNVIRRIKTGKWIPIKIINVMYKNYNKINKKKYEQYMVHK